MSDNIEWFAVENRVRKLIAELTEPTIRRSAEDREQITDLLGTVDGLMRRMDEIELIGQNANRKMSLMEDMKHRLSEHESQTSIRFTTLLEQDIYNVNKRVNECIEEIKRKGELITNLDNENTRTQKDMFNMNTQIMEFKTSAMNEAQRVEHVCKLEIEKVDRRLSSLDAEMKAIKDKTDFMSDQISLQKAKEDANRNEIGILNDVFANLANVKVDQAAITELEGRVTKKFDFIKFDMSQIQAENAKFLQNGTLQQESLEKYKQKLPFKIFKDMSSTFINGLEGNALRKVSIYLKERAELLLEKTTDENMIEKWNQKSEELETLIENTPVEEEKPPQIIYMTQEKSRAEVLAEAARIQEEEDEARTPSAGSQPSMISQKSSHHFISVKEEMDEEDEQSRHTPDHTPEPPKNQPPRGTRRNIMSHKSQPPTDNVIPETSPERTPKQRKSKHSTTVPEKSTQPQTKIPAPEQVIAEEAQESAVYYYSGSDDSVDVDFEEAAKKLRKELHEMMQATIESMNKNIEEVRGEGQENIAAIETLIASQMQEINDLLKKSKRDYSDIVLQIKSINNKVKALTEDNVMSQRYNDVFSELVASIFEIFRISLALEQQDEVDKQQIMLMGKQQGTTTTAAQSSVSMDKKCLSCNSNPGSLQQTFKLACLHYWPTAVPYRRKNYTRTELHEIKDILLTNAWERATSNTAMQNRDLKQVFDRDSTSRRSRSRVDFTPDILPQIKNASQSYSKIRKGVARI